MLSFSGGNAKSQSKTLTLEDETQPLASSLQFKYYCQTLGILQFISIVSIFQTVFHYLLNSQNEESATTCQPEPFGVFYTAVMLSFIL